MTSLVVSILFGDIALVCAIYFICEIIQKAKMPKSKSIDELDSLFNVKTKEKTILKKIPTSQTNVKVKIMFNSMKYPMFTEKYLLDNKNYFLAVSKFVEYKINSSKQTFRAKSNCILILQLANLLASELIKSGECKIFHKFKLFQSQFKLRQKEIKIFKILLADALLLEILKIESELNQISFVIQKSKNAKSLKKYRKMLLSTASLYGVIKYNKNSTKLIVNPKQETYQNIQKLFNELIEAEHRIKLAITYIKVLFC